MAASSRTSTNHIHTNISYDLPNDDDPSSPITLPDSTILIGRRDRLRGWLLEPNSHLDDDDDDKTEFSKILGFEPTEESTRILSSTIDSMEDNNGRGAGSTATAFISVIPAAARDSTSGSDSSKTSSSSPTAAVVPHRISLCVLPETVSRNNHILSVNTITRMISSICSKKIKTKTADGSTSSSNSGTTTRILIDTTGDPSSESSSTSVSSTTIRKRAGAVASAVAKAFPIYSRKSRKIKEPNDDTDTTTSNDRTINVSFLHHNQNTNNNEKSSNQQQIITDTPTLTAAKHLTDGVRLAARLMDMPPSELTTDAYAEECRTLAAELGDTVTYSEIVGEELREKGYGGLYGIGKAAVCPPRLVVMDYQPAAGSGGAGEGGDKLKTVALVGKGIVYDTGGLSLKPKTGMSGMKHDMGGSAAMLGAFSTAVQLQTPHTRIVLILCLAENAIGSNAVRNDDILALYSGKTVEINNTDAEGRIVLGDGVAHATKHYLEGLDLVVDMATLTGAQLIATGKKHAGILANNVELEQRAVKAGLDSGDLCFPLLYAPELLEGEFSSKVADMKNSVKDRGNAQASCAGHFIERHLEEEYDGGWLHVDMAGPGSEGERGTGWGVGFLCSLLEVPGL